jgi:hypothetical protein
VIRLKRISFLLLIIIIISLNGCSSVDSKYGTDTNSDDENRYSNKDHFIIDSAVTPEVVYNEKIGSLRFGMTSSEVISILGEANDIQELSLYSSKDRILYVWSYKNKGIELSLLSDDSSKNLTSTVTMITITNPCNYKTSKGIQIGSTLKDIKDKYTINDELSGNDEIVVGDLFNSLTFSIENDKVKKIFIGSAL